MEIEPANGDDDMSMPTMQKLVHTLIFLGAFVCCAITVVHVADFFHWGDRVGKYLLERGRE